MSDFARSPRNAVAAVVLVALIALPLVGSDFFVSFVMTRVVMLGLAASTIVQRFVARLER